MGNMHELEAAGLMRPAPATGLGQFTPRQLEVLALLCQGLPNKTIARRLHIACGTVKVHVAHILRTLNVASRLQAVVVARSLGLTLNPGYADRTPRMDYDARHYTRDNPLAFPMELNDDDVSGLLPTVSDRALAAIAG